MTVSIAVDRLAAPPPADPELRALALPANVGPRCEQAWKTFVSDPPASRVLAEEAFRDAGAPTGRAWGGLCLAYHQARALEAEATAGTLAEVRRRMQASGNERGRVLADVVAAYLDIGRGQSERAIGALEAAMEALAQSGGEHPLDRFLATHALALANSRLGRIDQVLHHHYANLLLLEQSAWTSPLPVVLLNLSSTLTAIDDWEEALGLARRAVDCCERMANAALRRRAEINVALALRFLGRLDEAVEMLERLRSEPYRDPGSDFALHINSAEALAQHGRLEEATRCLEQARACAAAAGDAHERVNLEWVAGLIAARAGATAQAVQRLEEAKRQAIALRKVHVPLLPRIVELLASSYARGGDHARAFETFQEFHQAYEARLGYTTRARYTSQQSRQGLAAIAETHVDRARLNEALRRTLAAAGGAEGLAGWSPGSIARIGSEARGLGVESRQVGSLVERLRQVEDPASLEGPGQTVRVTVLGEFAVSVGGKPLRFGRKRPERPLALLKFLAANGTRAVAESLAADALWPELDGDAALGALAVNIHRLRRLLGGNETVMHSAHRLSLDLRRVWCDAVLFDALMDRASASGDGAERDRLTERAIGLYRGDLAFDEDRERWALVASDRLRARFLVACAGQGARLAAAGRWSEACSSFARGLEIDPLAEELCLGYLRGCLALERPRDGIAAYRRFEVALAGRGARRAPAAIEALHRELLARA